MNFNQSSRRTGSSRNLKLPPPAILIIGLALAFALLSGCGADAAGENREVAGEELPFTELVEQARGTEVRFYMWGGSPLINDWIDTEVAGVLSETYGISLVRVPMDAAVFVNRLLSEKESGRDTGVMDILWINGENFRNAREGGILYGPFTHRLPNFIAHVDPATAVSDAGYPVDGYEAPYGRAQFVFEFDSTRVIDPPESYAELLEWAKANPGLFTYPQPPDFTGSAFIRQAFYELTGGHEQYADGFDGKLFERNAPLLWDYLNELEASLWRGGEAYPADLATLDGLFERGEVAFNMSFTQTGASSKIAQGRYRDSVRTMVFREASLANTHYLAIPFNAPNIPGALVAINEILGPRLQLSKNDPANWGDFTVLDIATLNQADRDRFAALDLGPATLPLEVLSANAVPEIPSEYLEALESGWEEHVLRN
jgi:putative spermidine/putrescine transport system substrate-binding protein